MSRVWSWRNAILESNIAGTTKHVLLVISCHMNEMGDGCYPSTKRLSKFASLSERTVCTHIEYATKLGWLVSKPHGFNGQGWARNEYAPSWPKGTEVGEREDLKGTEPLSKGTEPDGDKALKEIQSNISVELLSRTSQSFGEEKRIPVKNKRRVSSGTTIEEKFGEDNPNCPREFLLDATKHGFDPERITQEFNAFCDHHRAKGSKFVDHRAAFRTWCGNSVKFSRNNSGTAYRTAGQRNAVASLLDSAGWDAAADVVERRRAASAGAGGSADAEADSPLR